MRNQPLKLHEDRSILDNCQILLFPNRVALCASRRSGCTGAGTIQFQTAKRRTWRTKFQRLKGRVECGTRFADVFSFPSILGHHVTRPEIARTLIEPCNLIFRLVDWDLVDRSVSKNFFMIFFKQKKSNPIKLLY